MDMNLKEYLSDHGAQIRLAQTVECHPVLINQWANGVRSIPIERCVAIERATGGKVTRRDLRTDWRLIWPELANQPDIVQPKSEQTTACHLKPTPKTS